MFPCGYDGRHPASRKWQCFAEQSSASPRDEKFSTSTELIKKKRELFRVPIDRLLRSSTALPPLNTRSATREQSSQRTFPAGLVLECWTNFPFAILGELPTGRLPGDLQVFPTLITRLSPFA